MPKYVHFFRVFRLNNLFEYLFVFLQIIFAFASFSLIFKNYCFVSTREIKTLRSKSLKISLKTKVIPKKIHPIFFCLIILSFLNFFQFWFFIF